MLSSIGFGHWLERHRDHQGKIVTRFKGIVLKLITLGSVAWLTGCQKMEVLQPKGPVAADEKHLLITAVGLMLIIVVPVIILTLLIAFRYRASNKKAKYAPEWTHSVKLELLWWAVPIVIVSILAMITWKSTHALDPYKPLDVPQKPITIQVVSLNWRWLFIYPDQHMATLNFVEFPVHTPVNFRITSDAPMNSFQIDQLAGQIYAMAGMQTKLHLMADQVGDYNGRSVSFSGPGFNGMEFTARVVTADQFAQFVQTVQKTNNSLTAAAYNQLIPDSEDTRIVYYSSVDDHLFEDIMMKYMMPMSGNDPDGAPMAISQK